MAKAAGSDDDLETVDDEEEFERFAISSLNCDDAVHIMRCSGTGLWRRVRTMRGSWDESR